MIIKHKKYGEFELKLDDVSQGTVESFFRKLREEYPDNKSISGVEYQGDTVRVAMKLGWISPEFNVDEAKPPSKVLFYLLRKFSAYSRNRW